MGRQKGEGARTKARPSSSSLAASLLPAGTTAVGFGGYVGSSRVDSTLRSDDSMPFLEIDSEMAQHLKRLARKDPTTKLKALSSLSMLLKQKHGKDIVPMIPQWAFEYKRLLMDYNREVRRATHDTMTNLVTAVGRDLAPHLKSLMGPWWVSQFDSVSEVSQLAKQSFQAAFPTQEKRIDALMFCTAEIFVYLEENLKLTPESMADIAAAPDELADMHERVISSSLLALATLLDVLVSVQAVRPVDGATVETKHVSKAQATAIAFAEKLFSAQKYFLGFLKAQSPTVRSATYSLLRSYIKNVPQVYSEGDMKTLSTAILGAFHEVDSSCHSAMWEAILLFSKRFPGSWSLVNVQNIVLNRFWQFLKNGCFGSQQVSYPALVLFLESVPPEAIVAEKFFLDFFQNLWMGRHLPHPTIADRVAFFLAFKECFLWVLHNAFRYCNGEDATLCVRMSLVENVLVKLLWHDFLFYPEPTHSDRVSSRKPVDPLEDSIQLFDKNMVDVKYAPGYLQYSGRCLIEVMSTMYSLDCELLTPFCKAFQDYCLETFQQTGRTLDNLVPLIKFMFMLDQHAIQKAETWPLDCLVGPLMERSFPLFRSLESPALLKFLSVVISTFGPHKIIQRLPVHDDEVAGCVTLNQDRGVDIRHFLQVFEGTFVPWCFDRNDCYADAQVDLLLALLDDACFDEQWNSMITYATSGGNFGTVPMSHMVKLTMLVEKTRHIIVERKSKSNNCQHLQPEWWHHKLLDSAAMSIMHSLPLFGDSDALFICAVLACSRENDHMSFLSKSAIIQIYQEAFKMLVAFLLASPLSWVRKFGSLICDRANIAAPELKSLADVSKMSQFALKVLDGGFFCLKSHCQEYELVSGIATAIFMIDWECSLVTRSSVTVSGSLKNFNYREEFGKEMHEFRTKMSSQFWGSINLERNGLLAGILIQFIRSAIFEQDEFNDDTITSLCCRWVVDIIKSLCLEQADEQNVLDLLLSCDDLWPLWVVPGISSSSGQTTWKVNVSTSIHTSRSQIFVALVDRLISEIGFHKVLGGYDSSTSIKQEKASYHLVGSESTFSRAWLVAEILCTWKWPGGSALVNVLPSLSKLSKEDSCNFSDTLFDSMVNVLLEGALINGANGKSRFFNSWPPSNDELDKIEDPFLRALVSLLLTLFRDSLWGKKKAVALLELLANKLYIGNATNINCLHILPMLLHVLVRPVRDHGSAPSDLTRDSLSDSLSEDIIKDWLQKTLNFPPLVSWETGEDMEEWLQLVISCYPLSMEENVGAFSLEQHASTLERELLLNLFHKQRYGADGSVVANKLPVVQILLSRLIVIAVGYCWEEFTEEDWEFVLSHLRCWIEVVVVVMEEAVDSLDLAIKNAPPDNLELSIHKFEPNLLIVDPSCMDTAANALYAFSLLLSLVQFKQADKADKLRFLETEKCEHSRNQIEEGILRVFLSTGVAEAIAGSLHCESLSIIGSTHLLHPLFWKLIGSTVAESSSLAREEAIRSVERWGLSKGPINSLLAILFSSKPMYPLKFSAFVLLSSMPISRWVVTSDGALYLLSEDLSSNQDSNTPDLSPEDGILLREELSCLIEKLPIEMLDVDFEAPERINTFLAWCLVLSHLLALPSSSPERERLVQHIQEFAPSVILDMLFQHIPVELCAVHSLRKRETDLPAQLSDVAVAASRAITTGSLLFTVKSLWPIQPEKMALFAAAMFGLMLRVLPAYVRGWFGDIRDRSTSSAIEFFTKSWCSPHLIADELSQIKKVNFADECFSVSVSKSANEVIATYTKDETGMDLVIRLPASYPLRPVDVECMRSLGISEVKQRKWLLSMMAFVRNQNGALAEAIRIWKSNFDKAFEGIDECPICYSVMHTSNHSLPRLACKTCKHKFHSACLYKWFSTAHKSTCPLCQSPF
ncbi:hypothetical protein Ancab_007175 [Ancistrocladus abbreviatus]